MVDKEFLKHCPASEHWKEVGIYDHHGVALPLFSLHSQNSCQIGEYTDIFPLITWCKEVGFDVIQFLPLNDTGLGTSPYSAISAFALHPIYLGLSQLPYLEESPLLLAEIKRLQVKTESLRIDYQAVLTAKQAFLREYVASFKAKIITSESYQTFVASAEWLKKFAVFKALKIKFDWQNWQEWPAEFQNPTNLTIDQLYEANIDETEFHYITQYLCHQQMSCVKEYANEHNLKLMGDIPILICRDSADVWYHRDLFNLNYSAGAPPDMFTPDGQNWGFPLYNWERITELEFKWWIDRLQSAAAYYHIYRVDHIVGFFRIWAINIGEDSSQGFFMPEDENSWIEHGRKIMWTMLEKCHMLPIGEDLGVVPSQVRLCLSMLGICGTRVMRWEKKWQDDQSFTPTSEYPLDSMTTVSTHDCEPLKIWWQTCMAEAQKFAAQNNLEYHEELSPSNHAQILKWSHNSNSIFHINLLQEYLYLFENLSWKNFTDDRVNVPGTFCDDNWTVRFKPTLEEIITHEDLKKAMKEFSSLKS